MDAHDEPHISAELVERARAGGESAFGALVAESRPRLEALAHLRLGRRLRRHVEVEDVLQETYLRVARSLPSFEYRGAQATFRWLETLCEHVIQDLARHFRRRPWRRELAAVKPGPKDSSDGAPVRLLDLLPAPAVPPSRSLQRVERFERLEASLGALTPEQREVLILARVQALPVKEIALRMNRSEGAVGMLLTRAARRLREAFGTTDSWHLPAAGLAALAPAAGLATPAPGDEVAQGLAGGEPGEGSPGPPGSRKEAGAWEP